MNPNLAAYYLAEQLNRGRLESMATHGWLAEQAAATRSRATEPAQARANLGAALVRLGTWLQGTARTAGAPADPAALPAR